MEQVAHMLGVELDEEFNVNIDKQVCKFTEHGILSYSKENQNWTRTYGLLEKLLTGKVKIIKKPILDETEREYLSAVIKPFRNRVKYITKFRGVFDNEFIEIGHVMDNEAELYYIELPLFKKGTMYKGMEIKKEYTLDDLGL